MGPPRHPRPGSLTVNSREESRKARATKSPRAAQFAAPHSSRGTLPEHAVVLASSPPPGQYPARQRRQGKPAQAPRGRGRSPPAPGPALRPSKRPTTANLLLPEQAAETRPPDLRPWLMPSRQRQTPNPTVARVPSTHLGMVRRSPDPWFASGCCLENQTSSSFSVPSKKCAASITVRLANNQQPQKIN